MTATYKLRYAQEMRQKTFRYGVVAAVVGLFSVIVFYYLDQRVLSLGNTLRWRLLAFVGSCLFLVVASVSDLRAYLLGAYALMLTAFLLMISGIGYGIFADPAATNAQVYAVTIGSISVWFIVALVATSISRLMVIIGSGILVVYTVLSLVVVADHDDGGYTGFILSIFIMGVCAIIFLHNQGQTDRERAFSVYALEDSHNQILRQRQDLETANANLITFTHAMSHDLQGPLRRVSSFLDLYERKHAAKVPPSTQEYLDLAREQLRRGQRVVEDLLQYAQIGKKEVEKKRVDLRSLAQVILTEQLAHVPLASQPHIVYEIEQDPYLDEKLCWHLLSNLLSNAIKFTRTVAQPRISIGCHAQGKEDILSVQDNGVGFDENFKQSLGQAFKRLHDDETAGTGIGLSIVRQVVDLHHGRFWAESPPGEGASFYCAFPT